jgi:hypothetical protein
MDQNWEDLNYHNKNKTLTEIIVIIKLLAFSY